MRIHYVTAPLNMAQEAAEGDVAIQLLDCESALVRRLRSAINRIKEGACGVCLECEGEIAPKRLKATSWAALCISCQETAGNWQIRE